jgi:hypothetical protein
MIAKIILLIQIHIRAAMNDGIQMVMKSFHGSASHICFHQSEAKYSMKNATIAVINGIINRYFLFHSSSQYVKEIIGIYQNMYNNCRIGSCSARSLNHA